MTAVVACMSTSSGPATEQQARRWRSTLQRLADLTPHLEIDPPPAGLADELGALGLVEADPGPRELRVVVLDATAPGTGYLADVLTGGAFVTYPADATRPPPPGLDTALPLVITDLAEGPAQDASIPQVPLVEAQPLPSDPGIQPRWAFVRPGIEDAVLRAELLSAHAAVVVVHYRDVVVGDEPRHRAVAHQLRPWLGFAAAELPADLLTIVVDGIEASSSNPASRLGWTRQQVYTRLRLPDTWPATGIAELSSLSALRRPDRHPGGEPERWRRAGMNALLARTVGPFYVDPAAMFARSALLRCRSLFARARDSLSGVLHADLPDPANLPAVARQRRARLLGRGLVALLEREHATLSAVLAAAERSGA